MSVCVSLSCVLSDGILSNHQCGKCYTICLMANRQMKTFAKVSLMYCRFVHFLEMRPEQRTMSAYRSNENLIRARYKCIQYISPIGWKMKKDDVWYYCVCVYDRKYIKLHIRLTLRHFIIMLYHPKFCKYLIHLEKQSIVRLHKHTHTVHLLILMDDHWPSTIDRNAVNVAV